MALPPFTVNIKKGSIDLRQGVITVSQQRQNMGCQSATPYLCRWLILRRHPSRRIYSVRIKQLNGFVELTVFLLRFRVLSSRLVT